MTPQGIGSLLGGIGSIASGFGFGSGGGQSVDYRGAKKGIRWRVRDAKMAGIHPLYAMGAPGVGSGQIVSSQGTDPGAGLQGLGQAISGLPSRTQKDHSERMAFLAEEQARQNVLQTKQQSDLIQEQLIASRESRRAQNAVTAPEVPMSHIKVQDPWTGEQYWIPNQDVGIELPEAYGAWQLMKAQKYNPSPQVVPKERALDYFFK